MNSLYIFFTLLSIFTVGIQCAYRSQLTLKNYVFLGRHDERQEDYSVYHVYKSKRYQELNNGVSGRDHIVAYHNPAAANKTVARGAWLRNRYVGPGKLLQDDRISKLYKTKFLQTDYTRISEMASYMIEGFYPPGTGDLLNNGNPALDGQRSSVPQTEEPEISFYNSCPVGVGQVLKMEKSILLRYPNAFYDEFITNLQTAFPAAYQWYVNTWIPRAATFLDDGLRLDSIGGVALIGRSILVNPGTQPFTLLNVVVSLDEISDIDKFLGCVLASVTTFEFYLEVDSSNVFPNAIPYVQWLERNLISGRDDARPEGVWSSPEDNVVAVMGSHHSSAGFLTLAMNNDFFVDNVGEFSTGDFGLWERYEDVRGNRYIKTYFGKDKDGATISDLDIDLQPIPIASCRDQFVCTEEEFLDHLKVYLKADLYSECVDQVRPTSTVSVNAWNNGGNYKVQVVPGIDTFGWTLRVDFDSEFTFRSSWNGDFVSQEGNSLIFKNPDSYNFKGKAGNALRKVAMRISFPDGKQPSIERVWFNDVVTL